MTLPPRPHDPRDREVVARAGAWEVRQFDRADRKHAYFAPRGFLHLQLWHPVAGVSVLTPSRLTGGNYELWDAEGDRVALPEWADVMSYLTDLTPPGAARIAALERWFVTTHENATVALLRTWWSVKTHKQAAP
jgi:hypothetical protein